MGPCTGGLGSSDPLPKTTQEDTGCRVAGPLTPNRQLLSTPPTYLSAFSLSGPVTRSLETSGVALSPQGFFEGKRQLLSSPFP